MLALLKIWTPVMLCKVWLPGRYFNVRFVVLDIVESLARDFETCLDLLGMLF
jgi:hypothetical protein